MKIALLWPPSLLQENRSIGEQSYRRAYELLGTVGVVELTALVGYYTMVAMTLIAHEVPLPAGATPELPPPLSGRANG